jgi:hypothetical protein
MRRSTFRALASHAVMGAALGAALGLALIWIPAVHVASLIDHSMERWSTIVVICTLMATFGVDAALTGFLFLMIEDRAACRRAKELHLRRMLRVFR